MVAEPYNFAAQAVLGKPLIIYGAPTEEGVCVVLLLQFLVAALMILESGAQ